MASALEAARAVAEATDQCPHPESRARAVWVVPKGRGTIALCRSCKDGFLRIIREFDAGRIGPRQVVAQVVEMGYTRRDAATLLLGMVARRLGVRLGVARE